MDELDARRLFTQPFLDSRGLNDRAETNTPRSRHHDGQSGAGNPRLDTGRTAEPTSECKRLAEQLSNPTRLATEVLASWHDHHVEAAVLHRMHSTLTHKSVYAIEPLANLTAGTSLFDLLQAREDAPVQHRHVRMTIPRGVVGYAYAVVLMDEVSEAERRVLTETDTALGRCLQAGGVRRNSLSLRRSKSLLNGVGDEAVTAQAILCRGSHQLAYVQETFYPRPIPMDSGVR